MMLKMMHQIIPCLFYILVTWFAHTFFCLFIFSEETHQILTLCNFSALCDCDTLINTDVVTDETRYLPKKNKKNSWFLLRGPVKFTYPNIAPFMLVEIDIFRRRKPTNPFHFSFVKSICICLSK